MIIKSQFKYVPNILVKIEKNGLYVHVKSYRKTNGYFSHMKKIANDNNSINPRYIESYFEHWKSLLAVEAVVSKMFIHFNKGI